AASCGDEYPAEKEHGQEQQDSPSLHVTHIQPPSDEAARRISGGAPCRQHARGSTGNDEARHPPVHLTRLRSASAVPLGSIFSNASAAARWTRGALFVASLRSAGTAVR